MFANPRYSQKSETGLYHNSLNQDISPHARNIHWHWLHQTRKTWFLKLVSQIFFREIICPGWEQLATVWPCDRLTARNLSSAEVLPAAFSMFFKFGIKTSFGFGLENISEKILLAVFSTKYKTDSCSWTPFYQSNQFGFEIIPIDEEEFQ